MHIKILGPGCRNCQKLAEEAQKAVDTLGIDATIEKVTDYADIAAFGLISVPGIVVDDKVVSSGKVLNAKEIARLLPM